MRTHLLSVAAFGMLFGCAAPHDEVESSVDAVTVAPDAQPRAIGTLSTTCRGTLIAPDVVLTTASCVDGAGGAITFQTSDGEVRAVRDAVRHPQWAGRTGEAGWAHDIAYVVLDAPVLGIEPAAVAREPHAASCAYSGSGTTTAARESVAPIALCVDPGYQRGLLYAYGDKGYLCANDFGGPLRKRGTNAIVGVASFMTGQCREGVRGYYTAIAQNLDFVDVALAASALE